MEKLLFKESDEETPNGEKPGQLNNNKNNEKNNTNNIGIKNEDINTKKKENFKNKQKSILNESKIKIKIWKIY